MDAGAVPLLVLCIQEPEIALKRIAASALSDIAKHSPEVLYRCSLYHVLFEKQIESYFFMLILPAFCSLYQQNWWPDPPPPVLSITCISVH